MDRGDEAAAAVGDVDLPFVECLTLVPQPCQCCHRVALADGLYMTATDVDAYGDAVWTKGHGPNAGDILGQCQ